MKIAFCINTMGHGGAERVVSILANELSEDNEVTVYTLGSNESYYPLSERVKRLSLTSNSGGARSGLKLMKVVYSIIKLRRYYRIEKFDLMISFLPEASFVMMLAKLGCKKIICERNDPLIEYNNVVYYYLMRKLYKRADSLVAQTPDARDYFEKEINIDGTVILNPVDPSVEKYIGKKVVKRRKEIVAVGRLTSQKNLSLLIRAFSFVVKEIPDCVLKIYGDGPEKEKLERLVSELKLDKKVQLCGTKKNIFELIQGGEIFVLSSDYEGMPNALIEAMVLGMPVISTDCPCGGPRYLIEDMKNGILVPVGDDGELANKIVFLLKNKELRDSMGHNAAALINRVDKNKVMHEWRHLISEVKNKE